MDWFNWSARLVAAAFGTFILAIVGGLIWTVISPPPSEADNAGLPAGATLIWVRGDERAYQLADCIWFDTRKWLTGKWSTQYQGDAPAVTCKTPTQ